MALRRLTFGRPAEISSSLALFASLASLASTRIFPLGRVLIYSYTRMLVYLPLAITRLLVTRILPLGEYSFTRILTCSHTRPRESLVYSLLAYFSLEDTRLLVYSHARILALRKLSFARLLVCSFACLLVYSYTRLLVCSLLAPLPWRSIGFARLPTESLSAAR
jgi:hypothetical protein